MYLSNQAYVESYRFKRAQSERYTILKHEGMTAHCRHQQLFSSVIWIEENYV